jgi:hypothetical protein
MIGVTHHLDSYTHLPMAYNRCYKGCTVVEEAGRWPRKSVRQNLRKGRGARW